MKEMIIQTVDPEGCVASLQEMSSVDLTVIARPAFDNRNQDPANFFLYRCIQKMGLRVFEGRGLRVMFRGADIVHLHWPDNVLRSKKSLVASCKVVALIALLLWFRIRGIRIVWTAHNMSSHEGYHPVLERFFWALLWRMVDGVIFHSEAARSTAFRELRLRPSTRSSVIPLPDYGQMYDISNCRGQRSSDFRIGFIGRLRRYKGVFDLINAFYEADFQGTRLLIAGEPETEDVRGEVELMVADRGAVDLELRFLSDTEMVEFATSCDLVVLPFLSVTNSGTALLCLACGTPVLVPQNDYFLELRDEVGPEWVILFDGDLDGVTLNSAFTATIRGSDLRGKGPCFSEARSLDSCARRTVLFYQNVLLS